VRREKYFLKYFQVKGNASWSDSCVLHRIITRWNASLSQFVLQEVRMAEMHYKIDDYLVRLYGNDTKGQLTRVADKEILLYSEGKLVGHATFAKEGHMTGDSHVYQDVIYLHAPTSQYDAVIDLLRNEKPVYIGWYPKPDAREESDGDAYFATSGEPPSEAECFPKRKSKRE